MPDFKIVGPAVAIILLAVCAPLVAALVLQPNIAGRILENTTAGIAGPIPWYFYPGAFEARI